MIEQHAAWQLFNNRYLCDMRTTDFFSEHYQREVGFPISGHGETDKQNRRYACTRAYLTPVEIVTKHFEGCPIVILNGGGEIYELIVRHLEDWHYAVSQFGFPHSPPLDDLYLLEKFAELLYPQYVSYQLAKLHQSRDVSKNRKMLALPIRGKASQETVTFNDARPFEKVVHKIADRVGA